MSPRSRLAPPRSLSGASARNIMSPAMIPSFWVADARFHAHDARDRLLSVSCPHPLLRSTRLNSCSFALEGDTRVEAAAADHPWRQPALHRGAAYRRYGVGEREPRADLPRRRSPHGARGAARSRSCRSTRAPARWKLYEENSRRVRYLTENEETALREAIGETDSPKIALALRTGLRQGNDFRLRWEDVSFERAMLGARESKSGS